MPFEAELRGILRDEFQQIFEALRAELRKFVPSEKERSGAPMLSAKDVAGFLKVEPATVLGYIRSGRLKGSKSGKKWMVLKADLDAFLSLGKAGQSSSEDQLLRLAKRVRGL